MFALSFIEEASKEFKEASLWYEEQSDGLGDRFIDTIQRKLQLIQQFPERYPKRKNNFREAIVKTFPYIIIYIFYKNEGMVVINTIFHASRNPRKKHK